MRYPLLDWLRGVAILLMVIYHFCYDLFFFGYLDTAFGKGGWVPFRYVIVLLFLSLVGIVTYLVHRDGIRLNSVKKRTLQLFIACMIVTASSYFVAPTKMTLFGILQLILLSSLLGLLFIRTPVIALVIGTLVFVAGHAFQFQTLDSIWLHWLGMVENKRPALDYVPVFPWFGVVLIGVFIGSLMVKHPSLTAIVSLDLCEKGSKPVRHFHRLLTLSGQHSLVIYLLHQPLMFGGFYLIKLI